jgi:FkbM family methyltransferase
MGKLAAKLVRLGGLVPDRAVPELFRRIAAHTLRLFVQHVPPQGSGLVVVDLLESYIPPPRGLLRARHVSGYLTSCDLNDAVQKAMFYRGVFEPATSRMILDVLPVGGTFLDVGANAGHYTYLAAAAVGPSGCVYAIEAAPLNARRLRADLQANGLTGRVILHEVAVADVPGEMRLQHAPGPSPHGMRYLDPAATSGGELVSVTTLDEILPDLRADVVKIDVEGADLCVLRGMSKILAAHPPKLVVVEVIDSLLERFGDSTADVIEFMRGAGYEAPRIYDPYAADMLAFVPSS